MHSIFFSLIVKKILVNRKTLLVIYCFPDIGADLVNIFVFALRTLQNRNTMIIILKKKVDGVEKLRVTAATLSRWESSYIDNF